MAILPGTRLGPYEVLSAIGAGGMGEVYKARDTRLDRIVAIKVLHAHLADRAELRERFDREAKTIASLNHPHICALYDIGHQDDTDYLVMEYLEGETLAQRLLKGRSFGTPDLCRGGQLGGRAVRSPAACCHWHGGSRSGACPAIPGQRSGPVQFFKNGNTGLHSGRQSIDPKQARVGKP